MVIIAALPVMLLVGFAVRVLSRDRRPSTARRAAAWSAIAVALILAVVVTWAAIVFARGYHF